MSQNNHSTQDLTALIEALYAFISSVRTPCLFPAETDVLVPVLFRSIDVVIVNFIVVLKFPNKNRRGHWCNTCHKSSHSDRTCRRKGKNKTDKVKQASDTFEDSRSDKEAEHSFAFEINNYAAKILRRSQMLYWWNVVQLLTSSMMDPN